MGDFYNKPLPDCQAIGGGSGQWRGGSVTDHRAQTAGVRDALFRQAGWRSARRTDTSLEMPASSIVTPKSESATAIVRLL